MFPRESEETMRLTLAPPSVQREQAEEIERLKKEVELLSDEVPKFRDELARKDAVLNNLERMNNELERRIHSIRINAPSTAGRADILEVTNKGLIDENKKAKAEMEKLNNKMKKMLEKNHKDNAKHSDAARRSMLFQTMVRKSAGGMNDVLDMVEKEFDEGGRRTLGVKTEIIGDDDVTKKAQEKGQELGEKIAALVNGVLDEDFTLDSADAVDATDDLEEKVEEALLKLENLRTPEPEQWNKE